MSHFAVVAPPLFSHLQAMRALAHQLVSRGHRVTFIAEGEGDDFYPLSPTLRDAQREVTHTSAGHLFRVIGALSRLTDVLCQQLPDIVQRLAVDALIVDQMEPAGGLVAQALGLPYISVACALPVNREPNYPLPVMPFNYRQDEKAQRLYHASERIYDRLMQPHGRVIAHHARHFGLSPRQRLDECLSPLLQIAQCIPALDFPRHQPPACFHYVGALRDTPPVAVKSHPRAVPPRAWASLGTLQGHRAGLFHKIAAACQDVGAKVMIAHCDGLTDAEVESLYRSGASAVRGFVDQPAAIRDADVVITHGGLNTVLDAIAAATPLLAIPITFDQPAVAARVAYSQIGRRVSRFATRSHMAKQLDALLNDDRYRQRITAACEQLRRAGGAPHAASLIEQAITPFRPTHPLRSMELR
ncbi:glycosyltransferase [Enterobacter sp.]|uniref:glycosyltransferase n=1 Tax=Enterobacter sp. TaxID=42895 RepID=UPI002981FFAA|nr:glycosyltransferase [Enterobacter sp.]